MNEHGERFLYFKRAIVQDPDGADCGGMQAQSRQKHNDFQQSTRQLLLSGEKKQTAADNFLDRSGFQRAQSAASTASKTESIKNYERARSDEMTAPAPESNHGRTRRRIASPSNATKRSPTTGRPPIVMDLNCLRPLLNMTQPQAAQKLGVSLTSFKMACTRLGVEWTVIEKCTSRRQSEIMPVSSGTRGLEQSVRKREQIHPKTKRESSHTSISSSADRQASIACHDSHQAAKPQPISSSLPISTATSIQPGQESARDSP